MFLCLCRHVSERDVVRAGKSGVTDPDDLITYFQLNDPDCCGRCPDHIEEFVENAVDARANHAATAA